MTHKKVDKLQKQINKPKQSYPSYLPCGLANKLFQIRSNKIRDKITLNM